MAEIISEKKFKILIATGIFPPDIGGPATYSKLLLEELPKRGLGVEVASFGSVRHLPKLIRHFVYFLKILRKGFFADVIFAQDPVSVGLPSVLAAKIMRKKFILKVVGDYAWEQYCQRSVASLELPITLNCKTIAGSIATDLNYQLPILEEFQIEKFDVITELRRKVERWVAKKADKIIVPSEYLRKIVEMWGVESKRLVVIYNAFKREQSFNAGDIGIVKKDYIVSAGRLVSWKGFDVLIEIIKELPEEIKLKIVGSGPERKNLELKIKNLGLMNRIDLVGQLPHQKLLQCLTNAKIFVLNTAYEGLSHAILEAMAFGVPVITTNIGGNPELIKNGYNGILVAPNDKERFKKAILELWNNDELCREYVANSYGELAKFDIDKMINRIAKELIL